MIRWIIPLLVGIAVIIASFMGEEGWWPDYEEFMIGILFLYVALILMALEDIVKGMYLHGAVISKLREEREAMNHTIYKYEVYPEDEVRIYTFKGAQLLDVQDQYGHLCFWYMVDTDSDDAVLTYNVIGTGNPVPISTGKHVASVQQMGGRLVWHIFEHVGVG